MNRYPLFEKGRILKTELLGSLRDYAFSHAALEYQGYSEGILRGCEVRADDGELAVGPGVVKHKGFVYLLDEELRMPYEPTEQWEILKLRMEVKKYAEDYIAYSLLLALDTEPAKGEDGLEVCRFKLRKGARLRSAYKDFADMDTEYDTVNLLHAAWGGIGEKTLAPAVTGYFAEAVLQEGGSRPEDVDFAYLCLGEQGAVPKKILRHYVSRRLGVDMGEAEGNKEIYDGLVEILENIRLNRDRKIKPGSQRHQIIVD